MAFNEEDFERLNARIQTLVDDKAISSRCHGVVYLFLSNKFYCEQWEINEAITEGGNDCGVDAVYIDRRGDEPVVHIIQSKVFDSKRKARNAYPSSSLEKSFSIFSNIKG